MARLIIEGLRQEFPGKCAPVLAVDDLTISIDDGELPVLLGATGCGVPVDLDFSDDELGATTAATVNGNASVMPAEEMAGAPRHAELESLT